LGNHALKDVAKTGNTSNIPGDIRNNHKNDEENERKNIFL